MTRDAASQRATSPKSFDQWAPPFRRTLKISPAHWYSPGRLARLHVEIDRLDPIALVALERFVAARTRTDELKQRTASNLRKSMRIVARARVELARARVSR